MKHARGVLLASASLLFGPGAVAEPTTSAHPTRVMGRPAVASKAEAPPSDQTPGSTLTPARAEAPPLSVEQYQLENGLTVLLSEDHQVPAVAFEVLYLVGSGHEPPGRTGFAHLFEHLMFQGSANYDQEYFTPYEPIGGQVNGTTNADRTNYFELVPSQYAELPLFLESDRMRSLLEVLGQDKLDNQRDVVKNERRQRYENTPYGMAFWYLDEALYPVGHPYRHSTIGSHEDLTAASLTDVQEFFRKYYVPKNAALVVVGDFEPKVMRGLIEEYFADIPGGQRAKPPQAKRPLLETPKHWVVEDLVELPRVYYAWHSPAIFEPGDAELDLLSSVLTEGKSSRLFHSLVYRRKLAKDVSAFQISRKLSGSYVIQATAAPGVDLGELATALQQELEGALSTPPTPAELERARNAYKKDFFGRMESYDSRASLVSSYFLFTGRGDYVEQDYQRYAQASAEAVHSTGRKLLTQQSFVRIDFVPGAKDAPVRKLETGAAQMPQKEQK